MSMPSGSTLLRLSTLLALLCAPACGEDDDDSSSATEGTGSSGSGDSASSSASATTNNTSNTTSNTSTSTSAGTTVGTSTSTSAGTSDTGGGQTCNGDWTLGSVPFSGDPMLGQACDGIPPKNCADGTFITFGNGDCVCIALCSSLGVSVGQPCTQDGSWVCESIEATNASMNSAKACVLKDWNLCTMGGGGGTTTGGTTDTSTTSGGTTDTSTTSTTGDTGACTPSGGACTFSDECCSNDCTFDVCA